MQINWKVLVALTIASLLAVRALAETEVSRVPPTVVSKVWPKRTAKPASPMQPTVERKAKPPGRPGGVAPENAAQTDDCKARL